MGRTRRCRLRLAATGRARISPVVYLCGIVSFLWPWVAQVLYVAGALMWLVRIAELRKHCTRMAPNSPANSDARGSAVFCKVRERAPVAGNVIDQIELNSPSVQSHRLTCLLSP